MPARHPFFFHHLPIKRQDKAEADKTIQYIFRTELNRNIQPERNGELCQFLKRKTGKPVVTYMGQNDALEYLRLLSIRNGWNLLYKPHPIMERMGKKKKAQSIF